MRALSLLKISVTKTHTNDSLPTCIWAMQTRPNMDWFSRVLAPNNLSAMISIQEPLPMWTMYWAIVLSIILSQAIRKETRITTRTTRIKMILTSPMRRRMNMKLLCYLLSLKESATAVESQGTGHQSAMKRTILKNNGPFIRPSRVTSKHLRVPVLPQEAATIWMTMDQIPKVKWSQPDGPEPTLTFIKPLPCNIGFYCTISPQWQSFAIPRWCQIFKIPMRHLPSWWMQECFLQIRKPMSLDGEKFSTIPKL